MPIEGRTVFEASRAFSDHLNRLLNRTLTASRVIAFGSEESPRIQVAFRQQGRLTSAPLHTKYGPVTLYLGQLCEGVSTTPGRLRLITVEYKYTLTIGGRESPATREPLFRWEYVRDPQGETWCRHHLQGPVSVSFGRDSVVSLNDVHLPTGYVPIEEIIRFCLNDLGVRPLSPDWDRILRESYAQFRQEFVGPS